MVCKQWLATSDLRLFQEASVRWSCLLWVRHIWAVSSVICCFLFTMLSPFSTLPFFYWINTLSLCSLFWSGAYQLHCDSVMVPLRFLRCLCVSDTHNLVAVLSSSLSDRRKQRGCLVPWAAPWALLTPGFFSIPTMTCHVQARRTAALETLTAKTFCVLTDKGR